MSETIHFLSENMRCWNQAKAGMTKFNSYLGRIILTDSRFLFLSSGSSELTTQLAAGIILGPLLGNLVLGKSLTKNLDLSSLKNKGSLNIKISDLKYFEAKRRWDFGAYLSIKTSNLVNDECFSFMKDPLGLNIKVMRNIQSIIKELISK